MKISLFKRSIVRVIRLLLLLSCGAAGCSDKKVLKDLSEHPPQVLEAVAKGHEVLEIMDWDRKTWSNACQNQSLYVVFKNSEYDYFGSPIFKKYLSYSKIEWRSYNAYSETSFKDGSHEKYSSEYKWESVSGGKKYIVSYIHISDSDEACLTSGSLIEIVFGDITGEGVWLGKRKWQWVSKISPVVHGPHEEPLEGGKVRRVKVQ